MKRIFLRSLIGLALSLQAGVAYPAQESWLPPASRALASMGRAVSNRVERLPDDCGALAEYMAAHPKLGVALGALLCGASVWKISCQDDQVSPVQELYGAIDASPPDVEHACRLVVAGYPLQAEYYFDDPLQSALSKGEECWPIVEAILDRPDVTPSFLGRSPKMGRTPLACAVENRHYRVPAKAQLIERLVAAGARDDQALAQYRRLCICPLTSRPGAVPASPDMMGSIADRSFDSGSIPVVPFLRLQQRHDVLRALDACVPEQLRDQRAARTARLVEIMVHIAEAPQAPGHRHPPECAGAWACCAAAQHGYAEAACALLQAGVSPYAASHISVVHQAAQAGLVSVVRVALSTDPGLIDALCCSDLTPLQVALIQGRPDIVRLLTDRGATLRTGNVAKTLTQMFDYASFRDDRPTRNNLWCDVLAALGHGHEAFNAVDDEGKSLLHRAVDADWCSAVVDLLHAGANPTACNRENNNFLHTMLQRMRRYGGEVHRDHFERVLDALPADQKITIVNAIGAGELTPLQRAADLGSFDVVVTPVTQLLRHGADPAGLMHYLMRPGAPLTDENLCALMRIIIDDYRRRESPLHDLVDETHHLYGTLLMHTARRGHEELVRLLTAPEVNANWSLADAAGQTAADGARAAGHEEIAEYLEGLGEWKSGESALLKGSKR